MCVCVCVCVYVCVCTCVCVRVCVYVCVCTCVCVCVYVVRMLVSVKENYFRCSFASVVGLSFPPIVGLFCKIVPGAAAGRIRYGILVLSANNCWAKGLIGFSLRFRV